MSSFGNEVVWVWCKALWPGTISPCGLIIFDDWTGVGIQMETCIIYPSNYFRGRVFLPLGRVQESLKSGHV